MRMEKAQVSLPTELLEFAKGLIDNETYSCVDDVVIEALCRLRPIIAEERRRQEWLKAEVQKGIDSADRGECVNGPQFMEELMARFRTPAGQAR